MSRQLFTSESVSMGHPDKMCDQISDAVLDAMLEQDPDSRVACETLTTTGLVMLAGEVTTKAQVELPTLVRELGATQTQLQWLVDAYALVFAGLLLPFGALGDRYGRKGALQVGLVVFALGAVLASGADGAGQVIALRALMGVGAALVMPATLSLLSSTFPPAERPRAIAIWAGFAGAGGAIGMLASGALLEQFWWGSIFLVNVPVVVLALAVGARILPTSRDRQRRPLDPVGSLTSVVGMGALLYAIIEGPSLGWTSVEVVVAAVVGLAGLGAFGWWERRVAHPMLDLSWFRDARFASGVATITLAFFAMFGVFFLLTQYLQFVLGYSALGAGFASLPMAVMMVVVSPRSAPLVARFGPRRTVTTGLLVMAAGCIAALADVASQRRGDVHGALIAGAAERDLEQRHHREFVHAIRNRVMAIDGAGWTLGHFAEELDDDRRRELQEMLAAGIAELRTMTTQPSAGRPGRSIRRLDRV